VGKGKAASHTATLVRPKNEAEFYEMIHLFIMLIVALGMASATIVMKFVDDVVYSAIRMKESWKVAHELLMLYFREIDIDPMRLMHMGNVYRRGGQDTLLSEARRNAAASFRVSGGNLQLEGANDTIKDTKVIKPSGEGDEHSKRPCSDFNAGRPCKKLLAHSRRVLGDGSAVSPGLHGARVGCGGGVPDAPIRAMGLAVLVPSLPSERRRGPGALLSTAISARAACQERSRSSSLTSSSTWRAPRRP
jgi:hypothetical protein